MLRCQLLNEKAELPRRQKEGDAGYDLRYCGESIIFSSQTRGSFETGIAVEIPEGYYGRIESRSGLAISHGIMVLTGTIDSNYRGEVKVILYNTGRDYLIEHGERIAQLVICPCLNNLTPTAVESLSTTSRGTQGFGSSGKL